MPSLPAGSTTWLPWIAWAITVIASGVYAFYKEVSLKKIDIGRDQQASRLALELESLKLDFAQRKDYTDRMETNRERLEKEIERKDGDLWKAYNIIQDRDKTIKEQHDMIFELRGKVSKLEIEVNELKRNMHSVQQQQIGQS